MTVEASCQLADASSFSRWLAACRASALLFNCNYGIAFGDCDGEMRQEAGAKGGETMVVEWVESETVKDIELRQE